jgi:hypothetical protein
MYDLSPDLLPILPGYPVHIQLVRVQSASSGTGGVVTQGFVQQYTPNLNLRDREPCYIFNAAGGSLAAGVYIARLVGNYGSLPLYAVGTLGTSSVSSEAHTGGLYGPIFTAVNNVSSISVLADNQWTKHITGSGGLISVSGHFLMTTTIPGIQSDWTMTLVPGTVNAPFASPYTLNGAGGTDGGAGVEIAGDNGLTPAEAHFYTVDNFGSVHVTFTLWYEPTS